MPTVTRRRRWQDRYKDVETALFPGYCFTHISAAERHKVLNCQNVVRILTFNGEPVPVRVEEIESFRMLVSSQLSCEPCPALRQGDRVVVNRGPLKGAVGHFVRRGRRSRLELCVTAIGQAVSVEVDRGDVERC